MSDVCHVEFPKSLIKTARDGIAKGEEVTASDVVGLKVVIEADGFPTEGAAAEVAADARVLMDVEIPTAALKAHLETAKAEAEEGKSISMGCIKAKQVVEKHGEAFKGNADAEAAVAAYNEACPAKE